ncbi:MAG: hypothetical protein QNK70_05825 [Crocinitomicaceae bacterium]
MNRIVTIICLVIISNITFSQQKQLHEDIFLHSFTSDGDSGPSYVDKPFEKERYHINLEWKSIEKVDRVILIKSDQSEVFIIAGDLKKDIVVKDLGEGTYYIGYFLGRISIATETLIVGK